MIQSNLQKTIRTISPEETESLGARIGKMLVNGTVVSLYGDLGAGKTVFARGVARGLGITEPVTSPTFTVVQEYLRPSSDWLYHLDMYRIDDADAALAFGIEEFLFAAEAVTLVEWPERIEELLETPCGDAVHMIHMKHVGEGERDVTIPGVFWEKLQI